MYFLLRPHVETKCGSNCEWTSHRYHLHLQLHSQLRLRDLLVQVRQQMYAKPLRSRKDAPVMVRSVRHLGHLTLLSLRSHLALLVQVLLPPPAVVPTC